MEKIIDYFISVAECKSISKASELIFVSQPTLSRSISKLEEELGKTLMNRSLSGIELTDAGKIYLEYAKTIKKLDSTMKYQLKHMADNSVTIIRIGMAFNAISLLAGNITERLKKKYPDINVEISTVFARDIESGLKSKLIDFAIGPGVFVSSDIQVDRFCKDEYLLIVPPKYNIDEYIEPSNQTIFPYVDIAKLPKMDYVLQSNNTSVRTGFNQILKHHHTTISPLFEVPTSIMAIQAAENNIGCCITVLGHLANASPDKNLKVYQLSTSIYSYAALTYLKNKTFSPNETKCIDFIKKAIIIQNQRILDDLKNRYCIG